jgi:hypothetical protein
VHFFAELEQKFAIHVFIAFPGKTEYSESTPVAVPIKKIEKKESRRLWPLGLLATGLAGTAVMLFRGCWHSKMSWPIRIEEHSYQVCVGCGIKRLFDDKNFRAYGPFSYDLDRLIARDRSKRMPLPAPVEMPVANQPDLPLEANPLEAQPVEHRSAS